MPDSNSLVRWQVDHRLGGEEAVDLSLGGALGTEESNINLDLLVFLVRFSVHAELEASFAI